jgi:hypothetical protein
MPSPPPHISWFVDSGMELETADGGTVKVLEFQHREDARILREWAKHFREHYCLDKEIDELREGTGLTRGQYLLTRIFPSKTSRLGPGIRSGDFAEILVADYLEFLQGWVVPRTRYRLKSSPDESTKGTDILGFQLAPRTSLAKGVYSPDDVLLCVEVKAQFSGASARPTLQNAIDDSAKDQYRKSLSLNAMRQRLLIMQDLDGAQVVRRFQNATDRPYLSQSAAAAFCCNSIFDVQIVSTASTAGHPESGTLFLLVFKGKDMMRLVHRLYEVAADAA